MNALEKYAAKKLLIEKLAFGLPRQMYQANKAQRIVGGGAAGSIGLKAGAHKAPTAPRGPSAPRMGQPAATPGAPAMKPPKPPGMLQKAYMGIRAGMRASAGAMPGGRIISKGMAAKAVRPTDQLRMPGAGGLGRQSWATK